jgi:phosphate transport system permease protein
MSHVLVRAEQPLAAPLPIQKPRLPRWAPALVGVVSLAAATLLGLLLGWGPVAIVLVATLVHLVGLPLWSRAVENARAAKDRLRAGLVWVAVAAALVPLVSLLWKVVGAGVGQIDGRFLTWSMRNVIGDQPGGIYHALVGTVLITLAATLISVPIGLLSAVYLVEYGGTSRLAGWIRFLVDVMTGIPSIGAGLFAYALFALFLGEGVRLGLGGGVALAILMIPIVVRSAEEMLKLVPDDLREASYALGVPKWRTIARVVLPTAMGGIITGVTLAIARVVGETAPLLIIAGSTDSVNFDVLHDQMMTLPVFIYYSYMQPGTHPEIGHGMAWGAALLLILIVMVLNLVARLAGRIFAPGKGR